MISSRHKSAKKIKIKIKKKKKGRKEDLTKSNDGKYTGICKIP
jgi:hypothetical protein